MPNTHFNTDIQSPSLSNIACAPAIRAYLGGSFNPVHNSHIEMAMVVYNCLAPIAAEQQHALHVSLLPNARSPFKEQSTDPTHRLAMLTLAIQNTPLQISELELWQTPPVYSIDSVRTLRQRYPNDSLIFIMGMDSARSLEQWKNGLKLTNYVHLWIFNRSDHSDNISSLDNSLDDAQSNQMTANSTPIKNLSAQDIDALGNELSIELQAQITHVPTDLTQPLNSTAKSNKPLKSNAQGRIYIDPQQVNTISSTDIRQQLQKANHIAHDKPDSLSKVLNPIVYQYIIAHQLYSAAQFR